MRTYYSIIFLFFSISCFPQLKFIIEDFEGLTDGNSDIKENGIFTYGSGKVSVDSKLFSQQNSYLGQRAIKFSREGKLNFAGWGKGVGLNIELDQKLDHFNFYACIPDLSIGSITIRIEMQEDDNADNVYHKETDDAWSYTLSLTPSKESNEKWKLVSIPLTQFKDSNQGGDGSLNVGFKQGKLFTVIMGYTDKISTKEKQECYFDFLCFSKGKLPTGKSIFDPPLPTTKDNCSIGAFSVEGNTAHFAEIGEAFEKNFTPLSKKKLGIIHLFQPFGKNTSVKTDQYPSVERLNKVIDEGYIPMITLENHFENSDPSMKQPNLYSIVDGHFDSFFGYWASQIKLVKGTVLLRMLHEFNGDWYPWCVVKNDKDPRLLAKAFCYIHNIFKENNVTNVKFIWCPNSMSLPQESWNNIIDAYPGDDFVDYVGLDIYNGAGKSVLWRSFRKEAVENYFILTQQFPTKPLLICETASRERKPGETGVHQNKAEWIQQMSEALKTDLSKIQLISWFNETQTFKVNSSEEAKKAFLENIMNDVHFASGSQSFFKN